MLKIKYMGPKPQITENGVFFKDGKEDKYLYLKTAAQILLSLNKTVKKNDNLQVLVSNHEDLSDEDIINIIKRYEPKLEEHIQIEEKKYELHIQDEIKDVENHKVLNDEEKRVWINNINIMKEYMMQREINKLFYIHLIKAIKDIIKENSVHEIDIDFSLEHWHVLSTISGNLEYGTKSVSTTIKMEVNENKDFFMRMIINN